MKKVKKQEKLRPEFMQPFPSGSDFTSDLGKIIRPDEYFEFYHKNSRGGLPRGAYGKVTPFAVDALRGLISEKDTRFQMVRFLKKGHHSMTYFLSTAYHRKN